MRALYLGEALRVIEDYPQPRPLPGEALIRVQVAGICNTDLELLRGYLHFQGVPGHEFVGTVERAPGAEEWEGRRVVGEINLACGTCPTCRAGRRSHCPNRRTLGISGHDGAFAEYLTLPVPNLHAVPEALPDTSAVFAEPLAAACQVLQQVHVQPGARAIVIGDGKLGLLCAQVLALTGSHVSLVGHHRAHLEPLAQRGIATALSDEPVEGGADIVIEATGSPSGLGRALSLLRPRGALVLKSTYYGPTQVDMSALVVNEVTLVGSRCGPFEPALRLLVNGDVNVAWMIEACYPLRDAVVAFAHAARPGALKVLLGIAE